MNILKNILPFAALLAAGCCMAAVPISAGLGADMLAGIGILFLLCNPFRLLRRLSARLRACIACMVILILCAVQLPVLALCVRVYLILAAVCIAAVCRVCWADWRAAELVKQSPEVDRILEHLYYHGEFEARDAWTQYGCRETRSLLRQAAGVEVPESLIASSYMPVYCLGYLHGCKGVEELSEQLSQLDGVQERFDKLHDKAQDMQDGLNELNQEVSKLYAENQSLYTENRQLEAREAEYRQALAASDAVIQQLQEELSQLGTAQNCAVSPNLETPEEAPAPNQGNQDSEILRLFESGMSLSQIGKQFGISKTSAYTAKERAKKAQAQPA